MNKVEKDKFVKMLMSEYREMEKRNPNKNIIIESDYETLNKIFSDSNFKKDIKGNINEGYIGCYNGIDLYSNGLDNVGLIYIRRFENDKPVKIIFE